MSTEYTHYHVLPLQDFGQALIGLVEGEIVGGERDGEYREQVVGTTYSERERERDHGSSE